MSQPKSPTEFIQDAFSPLVAVLCSSDAEAVCRKNNLRFSDLLQPFAKMTTDVQFRDASNIAHAVKNFRVRFRDLRENFLHPNTAKMYLHAVVDRLCDQETLQTVVNGVDIDSRSAQNADYSNVKVEWNTRWFDAYRELALRLNQPSDHEFVRTFVGCLFVVSTSCAEPLAAFSNLTSEQYTHQHTAATRYPRWFHSTVFKHFVLIHDVEEATGNADALFEDLKMAYGPPNCTLLRINSRSGAEVRRGDADQQPNPFGMLMQYEELAAAGLASFSAGSSASLASLSSGSSMAMSTSTTSGVASTISAAGTIKSSKSMSAIGRPDYEDGTEDRPLIDDSAVGDGVLKHSVSMSIASAANGDAVSTANSSGNGTMLRDPLGVDEVANSNYDELAQQPVGAVLNFVPAGNTRTTRYGAFLTPADIDRLRAFVQDLLLHGVLPFLERTLRTLSENVANSKKSVQRSMLQLTKKLFSGNTRKPTAGSGSGSGAQVTGASGGETISIVYTSDSAELQLRKYADLALALQQYESAFQTYQSLRRDFQNEDAWLHYAGASEMCAVCLFLQQASGHTHTQRQYPAHYMDEAISTYLNVCRNVPYATRAALLSTEILKAKRCFAEAIAHYLRMTAEDSDLRSALFLEQAALCYAAQPKAALRKYAFHLVLAGFRFSKASLRRHSLRCYDAAWQLLRSRCWLLAEDLVIVTLSRHLHALRATREALDTFKLIFTDRDRQSDNPNQLAQSAAQTVAYLVELLTLYRQYLSELPAAEAFADLEIPSLVFNHTKVLLCDDPVDLQPESDGAAIRSLTFPDLDDEALLEELSELENSLIRDANGKRPAGQTAPVSARSRRFGYRVTDLRGDAPIDVLADCPLRLLLHVRNALNVPLTMRNLRLVCRFEPVDDCYEVVPIESVVINPAQTLALELAVKPRRCGDLFVTAITYELGLSGVEQPAEASVCVRQMFPRQWAFRVRELTCPFAVRLVAPPSSTQSHPAGSLLPVGLHFIERRSLPDMIQLEDDTINRSSIRNVKVATSCNRFLVADATAAAAAPEPVRAARAGHVSIVRHSRDVAASSTAVLDVSLAELQTGAGIGSNLWLRLPDDDGQSLATSKPTRLSIVVYFEHGSNFYVRSFQCVLQSVPTLQMAVAMQRSVSIVHGSTANSLLATVTIENRSSAPVGAEDASIALTQLTTASRRFALSGLLSASSCRIGPQQTAQFLLRLDCIRGDETAYASVPLVDSESAAESAKDPTRSPSVNFYLLDRAAALSSSSSSRDRGSKPVVDSRRADVDFILFWRSSRAEGQSHVFIDRIDLPDSNSLQNGRVGEANFEDRGDADREKDAAADERLIASRLVRFAFELGAGEALVRHCFAKQRFCIVQMRIHVHNLVSSAVRVRIDACSKRVAYRPTPAATPSASPAKVSQQADDAAAVLDSETSSANVTCMPRNAPLFGALTIVGASAFELLLPSADSETSNATVCVRIGVSQPGIYDIAECFDLSACVQQQQKRDHSDTDNNNSVNCFISQTYLPTCMLVVENVDK